MPQKYDRCIKKVRKSLKKYHRKGNPYAICSKVRRIKFENDDSWKTDKQVKKILNRVASESGMWGE